VGVFYGLCVSWVPFDYLAVAFMSPHWPACRGRIAELNREVSALGSSTGLTDRRILYTYKVNGKAYTSSVVGGMVDVLGGLEDQLIKENYPIGKSVDVYYNPSNPAQSCLRTGFQAWKTIGLILWLLFGLYFVLVSVLVVVSKDFLFGRRADDDDDEF
jgi:hypothetical protein